MGGAAGHMMHLHEDLDLTFNELIDVINSVSTGDISATEKVDGQNIMFTVSASGDVKTARNKGDLKRGGMSPTEYAEKWRGHPAGDAFRSGFAAIQKAVCANPEYLLEKKIFVTVNFKSITELNYYKRKYKNIDCVNSKKWGNQQISLPFHAKLKDKEILEITNVIKKYFKN